MLRRQAAAALLAAAVCASWPGVAHADDAPPTTHTKASQDDAGGSTVTTTVGTPGSPGGAAGSGQDQGAAGGVPQGPATCTDSNAGGAEVPCTAPEGSWSNDKACYLAPADPPPPLDNPIWQGHTDGGIWKCFRPGVGWISESWAQDAPASAAAPPNPAVMAQQAIGQLHLEPIKVGMVPEDKPGYQGAVGLPVWMWVDHPSPTTWGAVETSVTQSGFTVNVRAYVASVSWDMGDGNTVTCTSSGVPYDDSYGNTPSPTCGYRYAKKGTYTVTATSHWVVEWSGIGQRGTLNTTTVATRGPVKIGEIQVVNR